MNIHQDAYSKIIYDCPAVPPESGGLIGGIENIISLYEFDSGQMYGGNDQYYPNIHKINCTIREWTERGLEFYGMFHSHFPGGEKLSGGDRKYIERIMLAMPASVSTLFFPIIFPKDTMIAYRADRCDGLVQIVRDEIRILQSGGR